MTPCPGSLPESGLAQCVALACDCAGRGRARGRKFRSTGFTLLELLVVISIIAIATAGVSFAMRDSAQTALERDGERLAALLESARAMSRTTGQTLRWRDTPQGFTFEGINADRLPKSWLNPDVRVRWASNIPGQALVLGPDPIIEPQTVTLVQAERSLRIGTDGLHPFKLLVP